MKTDSELLYTKCNLTTRHLRRLYKIEVGKMNENFAEINNAFLECLFDESYGNFYINIFNYYNGLWIYYANIFNKNNYYKTITINEYWFHNNYKPLENL